MPENFTKHASEMAYSSVPASHSSLTSVLEKSGGEVPLGTDALAEPMTRTMRRFSLWLILLLVASFTFLDYWSYSADYHLQPGKYDMLIGGTGPAPAQYRVGVVFAAAALRKVIHLGFRHIFALFDFIFAIGAVYLLRAVLAGTRAFQTAPALSRWLRLFIYLLLFSFYLGWTIWFQRPETLACTFFVAASLYLLCVVRSQPITIAGLLLLAILQGAIRADVAILFHLGLFLYVLLRGSKDFFLSRGMLLLVSFMGCVVPTTILYILMRKVFPHATYGDTPVLQLLLNMRVPMLIPFVLFMLPVAYTWRRGFARLSSLEGPQGALLLISLIYLASWAMVGRLEEVRIFVPFALALMPLTANLVSDELATMPSQV